jgi:Papain-like cysteine protease AvrRpt2
MLDDLPTHDLATDGGLIDEPDRPLCIVAESDHKHNDWCWAYVGSAISEYYLRNGPAPSPWTPAQLANQTFSRCDCDATNNCDLVRRLDEILTITGNLAAAPKGRALTEDEIRTEYAAKRPIGIRVDWGDSTTGVGHALIVRGIFRRNDEVRIDVTDPDYGTADYPLSAFQGTYTEHSGTWTVTYFTGPSDGGHMDLFPCP